MVGVPTRAYFRLTGRGRLVFSEEVIILLTFQGARGIRHVTGEKSLKKNKHCT